MNTVQSAEDGMATYENSFRLMKSINLYIFISQTKMTMASTTVQTTMTMMMRTRRTLTMHRMQAQRPKTPMMTMMTKKRMRDLLMMTTTTMKRRMRPTTPTQMTPMTTMTMPISTQSYWPITIMMRMTIRHSMRYGNTALHLC